MKQKRSITVKGHRTSVALEAEFWAALQALADFRGIPLHRLVVDADLARSPEQSLATCLRVMALEAARHREI